MPANNALAHLHPDQIKELSREQLVEIVLSLKQAKETKITKKKQKEFDMSKYPKRLVALRIAYIGFNYQVCVWFIV
jgi:hypothetical protein